MEHTLLFSVHRFAACSREQLLGPLHAPLRSEQSTLQHWIQILLAKWSRRESFREGASWLKSFVTSQVLSWRTASFLLAGFFN